MRALPRFKQQKKAKWVRTFKGSPCWELGLFTTRKAAMKGRDPRNWDAERVQVAREEKI